MSALTALAPGHGGDDAAAELAHREAFLFGKDIG
jgi:hypothetical protein